MATWFIDPESGSNANAGSTFGAAWLTLAGATAAKGVAAGDTVRVKSALGPYTIDSGNVAWTINTKTIVLANACTANIETCDSTWTASTNVVFSSNNSRQREGSACVQLDVAAAFVTGKIGFKQIALTDFSAYSRVSFWLNLSTASKAAGTFTITLCSDTAGNTPVNTIAVPATGTANAWQCVTVDNGGALGSNIQSVAINALIDPGTVSIYLDNILACQSATASNGGLSLSSVVGKNTTTTGYMWYALRSINGTTVTFESSLTNGGTQYNYVEDTESVTTYRYEPTALATNLTAGTWSSMAISGTLNNNIIFSGGWDRTNMSTQTGLTSIDFLNYNNGVAVDLNNKNFLSFTNMNFVRTGYCFFDNTASSTNTNLILQNVTAAMAVNYMQTVNSNNAFINQCGVHPAQCLVRTTGTLTSYYTIKQAKATASSLVSLLGAASGVQTFVSNLDTSGATDIFQQVAPGAGPSYFNNCRFYDATSLTSDASQDCYFNNCIAPSVTTSFALAPTTADLGIVYVTALQQSSTNHGQQGGFFNIITTTAARRTNTGVGWKISPTNSNYNNVNFPIRLRLGAQLYKANTKATVTVWVNRSNNLLTAKLVMPMGSCSGLTADVTSTSTTTSTWEQLKITFTPTATGVYSPEIQCWATNNASFLYIDDVEFR